MRTKGETGLLHILQAAAHDRGRKVRVGHYFHKLLHDLEREMVCEIKCSQGWAHETDSQQGEF